MPEDTTGDGELRRRAAWLLGLLVVVAVLIVVVMTTLLRGDKGGGDNSAPLGPDPITATAPPTGRTGSGTPGATTPGTSSSAPSSTAASSTSAAPGAKTCPSSQPCALDGDVGNAAAAIASYLKSHGRPAVPVTVSDDAKKCALNRGDGCDGGWAETELSAPADGTVAVNKISQFAKFTSTTYSSIDIGWAYDPGSKTYYFVTIRQS